MTTPVKVIDPAKSPDRGQSFVSSGERFDWVVVALSAWLLAGLYLDGWAHRHLSDLETFFTPWHGVLYSGFGAAAAYLGSSAYSRHAAGYSWHRALPAGYIPSLLGVLIFLAGGVGDMVWHTLFGVEVDLENLLSPTHLILALGGVLIMSGPRFAASGYARRLIPLPGGLPWRQLFFPLPLSCRYLPSLLCSFIRLWRLGQARKALLSD